MPADNQLILAFARDLFHASFGPAYFTLRFGSDGSGYLTWLQQKTLGISDYVSVVIVDGEPAGFVVLGPSVSHLGQGHVFHYYLIPAKRGRGLAPMLDQHAADILRRHGFARARLHVAPDNAPAIRFYRRQGWRNEGPVPEMEVVAFSRELKPPCSQG